MTQVGAARSENTRGLPAAGDAGPAARRGEHQPQL